MRYAVLQPITFGPGSELVLSEQQFARREQLVRRLEGGRFITVAPVQFKAGEQIECDGDLPKGMAVALEAVLLQPQDGTPPPAAATRAKSKRRG